MALTQYDVIRIIGKRQTASTYDVVELVPDHNSFNFQNPIIAPAIPVTGNTTAATTKLVNLRRVQRDVPIVAYIWESSAMNISDTCLLNVTVTSFDTNGTFSGGTAVTSILKKKWILEQMAMGNGTGGEALTMQWRGVINPAANPPADETYNEYHKKVVITSLVIEDEAGTAVVADANGRIVPERMKVTMTMRWGDPQK